LIWLLALMFAGPAAGQATPATGAVALTIAAGGDTMMGSDFRWGADGLPENDGEGLFGPVEDLIRAADVAFLNLEGPLIDGGTSQKCGTNRTSCYAFRTPTRYVGNLVSAGIDVVSLANNHAMDFGPEGRNSTRNALESAGILYAGTIGDVARWSVGDLRLSLVAFAPNRGCYDLNNRALVEELVTTEAARSDIVLVSFHGGGEGADYQHVAEGQETFYGENRGDLRAFSRAVIDAGADLVIGHGPHVLRGMEVYRDRLTAYSLGNFLTYGGFNLSGPTGLGALLMVDLDSEGRFVGGKLVPTIQFSPGGPRLDPDGGAITRIRDLSETDFPGTAPTILADGTLVPGQD
jgi:capsule synthesis protein PGA_cap